MKQSKAEVIIATQYIHHQCIEKYQYI